jgi:processive 1,2-diacylglycerol beta-glucosyltransferase
VKSILLFSVSIGAGHDLAAQALIQEINSRHPECRTMLVDTFKYINPVLDKVISGSYMESLKFNPKIWGYLYDQAEQGAKLVDLGQVLSKLVSVKMKKLLNEFEPEAIICTHAFPAGILSILKGNGEVQVPLLGVLTDYTVHPFWIHSNIDKYVIPCGDLMPEITAYGIEAEKILSAGIPLRTQFTKPIDRQDARRKLGLADKTTFLVMGGGLGLGEIEKIISELGNADINIQIVAVAGKNHRLQTKLQLLSTINKVKAFGFVDNMAEVMAACDFIVTKPGGLTTAEVLAVGRPMIIFNPLPGQENRNTDFLLNSGVAIKVRKLNHLVPQIKQLLSNEKRQRVLGEMIEELGKPMAAVTLVDYMEELLCQKII